jgi:hypothetical protein
LPPAPP